MKHTIEVQNDEQYNLIFKALDMYMKFQLGQWHYAIEIPFPYGRGLDLFTREHRALYTLLRSLFRHPVRLSIRSKKLEEETRACCDMVQALRHHTYKLKTQEEQKAEPDGKKVYRISKLNKPISVKLTKDSD